MIKIAERLRPFSHQAGMRFVLPMSSIAVQVFPTRLSFSDLAGKNEPFHYDFAFKGPLKEFTAQLDLEKGHLCVFGFTRAGYMRYFLKAEKDGVVLDVDKPKSQQLRFPLHMTGCRSETKERLSLGEHKAQVWEDVKRRLDFKEIFPHWFALSQCVPGGSISHPLLEACRLMIANRERVKLLEAFESFFLAAFEGVLVPRLVDTEYQGILPQEEIKGSPLPLLTEGGKLIRSLFFQEDQGVLSLLPCLPPEFHCGRMLGVKSSRGDSFDMEWTKKTLRKVRVVSAGEMTIKLPKGIVSCRMKIGRSLKKFSVDKDGHVVCPAKGIVLLDRFEN